MCSFSREKYGQWIRNMWHRHKITPAEWVALFNSQGRRCAVCKRTDTLIWHVDHDKNCCPDIKNCGECIRGILCEGCNRGLGHFEDDVAALSGAIEYLVMTSSSRRNEREPDYWETVQRRTTTKNREGG